MPRHLVVSVPAIVFVMLVPAFAYAMPKTEALVEGQPIPAERASAIPAEGVYISGSSVGSLSPAPEGFYIAYLDAKGLHEVFREDGDWSTPYGRHGSAWIDATHLITVELPEHYTLFAASGTDRVTKQAMTINDREWQLRRGEKFDEYDSALLVTAKHAWLERCMKNHPSRCKYMRIWGGERKVVTTKPRGVIPARVAMVMIETRAFEKLASIPVPPAPKGYKVTVKTHSNNNSTVTCTGPGSKHVTPDDDDESDLYTYGYRPTTSRWVVTDPPIFAVKGTGYSPVGDPYPLVQYHRACDGELGEIRVLRPRIWGEIGPVDGLVSNQMVLHIDDVEIGRVAGDESHIAVSPPP